MSTDVDLRTALAGDAGVAARVANRIYPGVLPATLKTDVAAHWPAICTRQVSGVRIGGVTVRRRMQVDIYAPTFTAAREVREAVTALADRTINWEYVEGPDLYEFDSGLHHHVVDLLIS